MHCAHFIFFNLSVRVKTGRLRPNRKFRCTEPGCLGVSLTNQQGLSLILVVGRAIRDDKRAANTPIAQSSWLGWTNV